MPPPMPPRSHRPRHALRPRRLRSPRPELLRLPLAILPLPRPDPSRATGYRLAPALGTLPTSQMGVPVDPAMLHRADGYPIGTPIMTHFARLDLTPLPQEESIDRSIAPDSLLGLFELTTDGARPIPCFAELDLRERDIAARTSSSARRCCCAKTRAISSLCGTSSTPTAPPSPRARRLPRCATMPPMASRGSRRGARASKRSSPCSPRPDGSATRSPSRGISHRERRVLAR
jgi:hypothetical protein